MIGRDEVAKLAELSRISISDEEAEALRADIDAVLVYIDRIGSAPSAPRTAALSNVLREDADAHEPGAHSAELIAAAPVTEGDYVRVKQVLAQ